MRLFDLLRRHFLDHFLKADRRVGVAADGGKRVPHVGADEIGGGHAEADFVVPADAGLRAGVAFHGRAEVPFERAFIVLLDAEADPRERVNFAAERPDEVKRLRELASEFVQDQPPWDIPPPLELDEMDLNQLRALGYAIP